MRKLGVTCLLSSSAIIFACGADPAGSSTGDRGGPGGGGPGGGSGADASTPGASPDGGGPDIGPPDGGELPVSTSFQIQLVPEVPASGPRRVSFAVPLAPGALAAADQIQLRSGGQALATARRALATWPDGSLRSVQIQIEIPVTAPTTIDVAIGEAASAGDLALTPVEQTLVSSGGGMVPAVWAILPASYLSASRFAGPALPSADVAGTPAAAWDGICDYAKFDTTAFQAISADRGSWLYDRPTALYRGYQRTGSAAVLRSAFREASLYREGITGSNGATRIGVAADDLKYHYTQGLALHYLLTGDDRFREAAENVAVRAHDLWGDPGYAGGDDFWTERHAGFGLLAYEWAAAVSDDRAATFEGWASAAVTAYLSVQSTYPAGYTNADERCFAHSADAHDEGYGYFGCSPWMSAILADGLDTHADRRARAGDAAGAALVRASLVRLGRFIAAQGRDPDGRPYYWAGVGVDSNEADEYEEHWGESAYVVALAWFWSGKTNAALKTAADALVAGLDDKGEAGQLRSFNWQCRSGVIAPYYLRP